MVKLKNMRLESTYKMYLVVGDFVERGHQRASRFLLECNVPILDVQEAYLDACKLTGVSFDKPKNPDEENMIYIACAYEQNYVSIDAFKRLEPFGINQLFDKAYMEIHYIPDVGVAFEDDVKFLELWVWFVRIIKPDIEVCLINEESAIPTINDFSFTQHPKSFGYGIY